MMSRANSIEVCFSARTGVPKPVFSSHYDDLYQWTPHALDRWAERFSGIDKHTEFSGAGKVGKKSLKKIRILTPVNAKRYMDGKFKGRYSLLGRSNVVFVINSDTDSIVTVFHLYGDESKNG
jgi:hypothetical protein